MIGFSAFSIWFLFPLLTEQARFSHPEYVSYYFGHRIWFLGELLRGHFPTWNPYWGIGHTSEIELSFPIDTYTFLELAFGPRYLYFQALQLVLLLTAVVWSLRALGANFLVSASGALLFFFSPWVTYYFLYFIKVNSFIAFIVGFPLVLRWFEKGDRASLYLFTLVTAVSLFGTKLEFWFYHFSVFSLLAVVCFFLIGGPVRRLGYFFMALLLAASCHLWQIIPLAESLKATSRLIPAAGASQLLSAELYEKLWKSLVGSDYFRASLRESYYAYGVGFGLLLGWQAIGRSGKRLLEALLFFLPICHYWMRPIPGDLNEVGRIASTPITFQLAFGAVVALGCFQIRKSTAAKVAYALILALFFCREQGQILMAYLLGSLWMPTRDNFLFDFLFAVIGAVGLARTLPNYRLPPILIILAVVAYHSPIYNEYNASIVDSFPDYTAHYEGEPDYRNILSQLKTSAEWRGYFVDGYDSLSMFAPSVASRANQVARFSSLNDARFKDWVNYQAFGILPEERWDSYPPDYTKRTIDFLPRKNTKGYSHEFVYWHTLPNIPPLKGPALRLLGVRHLISRKPLPYSIDWGPSKRMGGFFVSQLRAPLPRAFLLPVGQGGKEFLTSPDPKWEGVSLQPVPFKRYEAEEAIFEFHSSEPATFVLTDLFHPFWEATLDGNPVDLFPAFSIFRGVEIPPGFHDLRFRCRIPGFQVAGYFSCLAWVILSFLGLSQVRLTLPVDLSIPKRWQAFSKRLLARSN